VIGAFVIHLADLAPCILEDVFVNQGRSAMDSFLGEQPPEELNSWGSEVLPDELEGWARTLSMRQGTVDHA